MNRFKSTLAIIISIFVLAFFFLELDGLFAGRVPQAEVFTYCARFLSFIGDGLFLGAVSIVILAAGAGLGNADLRGAGKEGLYSLILSGAIVHILKAAFERPRIAHGAESTIRLLENTTLFDLTGKFNSFPSGHAAASFAVAYVLSKKFPRLALPLYLIAILISASRVYLGSHFPTDVLAGAFVGIGAGYLLVNTVNIRDKRLLAGFVLLVIFISFFKTGGFLLFDVDEAVFSEATREMVETGNYITPTYNFEPRYDKPILFYWLMSIAFKLMGTTEFAARFTSSLFGVFLVIMTFIFVRRTKGAAAAYLSGIALLLNLEFFIYSHSAVTDMTLSFFITGALYSFYLAVHEDKTRYFMIFWASMALATLTKGVIGLLFPVVIAIIYLAATRSLYKAKRLFRPRYIIIFLLISVPWFALEFYINGREFFDAFIMKHHVQRYSGVISSHGGPFYYYIWILLIGFFPWVAFLPSALYKGFRERLRAHPLYLFSAIWFVFVLVFFSIARTKLPNYIFPLFPAGAVLSALAVSGIIENRSHKSGLYILLGLSVIISAALFIMPSMGIKMDVSVPAVYFYFLGAVFLVIAALSVSALSKPLYPVIAIAGLTTAFIVFLRIYILPPANVHLQKTLYDYARYARNLGDSGVLMTYEINRPSIAFYARRKVVKVEKASSCDIKEYGKRGIVLVITSPSKYAEVEELKGLQVIDESGGFMLLGNNLQALPMFD